YIQMYSFDMYRGAVSQALNKDLASTLLQRFLSKEMGWAEMPEQLQRQFDQFMAINPNIELYLLDGEGRVLASTTAGVVKGTTHVALGPIRKFVQGDAMFPLYGEDPAHAMGEKVFSAAPIDVEHIDKGYLYVVLGSHGYDAVAQRLEVGFMMRQGLWLIVASLLAVLLLGIGSTLFLTRWLRLLAQTMQTFERGKFLEPVPHFAAIERPGDEIDRLGKAYNAMVGEINAQLRELKNTDTARRELIANVSHDLRTPLAALRGYLETLLLKDATLAPAERNNYLQVAVKQSEHLSALVAELFELTKLESTDIRLNAEPFQLAELAQDVVQKFTLAAQQKDIRLIADIERDVPFIAGDIALLERVFENLLENALRHTDAGGCVTIRVLAQQNAVAVEVRDTGHGIPAADLPHVFDRFYRVDKSRNEQSGGAGLGLAIAKRAVELHGGDITVTSDTGRGSCFRFALPSLRASSSDSKE
ncbi:MAG TPA: ATP-binding protein, partial [Spongiibacteraceae bacterium]|nr:ATP-binding protein [Spongiibacteraceae bacterium]